ncbi:endonuclease/exonuclease/phosphatase family protein [Streptomyces buecherae]|uniref:endonuclease/exonuclease/phosphatase family protein n=1 Tax=Streptomyces buecherae TaxID=2763006 RepID=UPI00379DFFFC
MADELVVVSWNVKNNGGVNGGDVISLLQKLKPDILFRQGFSEVTHAGKIGLHGAGALLGLTPFSTEPKKGRSQNPVGVLVNPSIFEVHAEVEHDLPWRPILQVKGTFVGGTRPLSLLSAHLTHFDPSIRQTEALRITTVADHCQSALVGMDANSYPHRYRDEVAEPIDWGFAADPVHYMHRTIPGPDGERISDMRPSEILTGGKAIFTDLAHYAGTSLDQPDALKPTSNLWRDDQGPRQRTDWLLATSDVASALQSVEVVDGADVACLSDHALLVARFGLAELRYIFA